ncbi:hypothetical protein HIM_07345 [Hirsutella minnesotensis 3608]|uniref:Prolyl 4-hydroxylase alpha subunit Fe(2+) 2OG dioxygenase domain-containing protein n=1 Tax=Hirsutella minnesotensis 3608 TaxID=1043627 RepID=A0A0F7ZI16_9HYPO|nr:hypothetical protein HIM_07345 [Hirsutella minnesotensis 3608]
MLVATRYSPMVREQYHDRYGCGLDSTEYKLDLLDALQGLDAAASFASFNRADRPPSTGLNVSGIGDIRMPLCKAQSAKLIAMARQAAYGKGSDTIVDTSARNTWELDASQFSFENQAWPAYLKGICVRVAQDLGITAPIKAKMYKMLIYEKGAMFKPHTDTEKIPGMFGTLVVCLPSSHTGGDVVVKHCGEKKVFRTQDYDQSYVCWYSDVSHEMLPVLSGIRWVLTYNLAVDPQNVRPTAGLQDADTKDLRDSLRMWLREPCASRQGTCPYFYYVLDHDHREANISLANLKTNDLMRVKALQDLTAKMPFQLFLALLEKEELGSTFHDYDCSSFQHLPYDYWYGDDGDDMGGNAGFHEPEEVHEFAYRVKNLVDLDGRLVSERLELKEEHILQDDCFDNVNAEEDYEGYMGIPVSSSPASPRQSQYPRDSPFSTASKDTNSLSRAGTVGNSLLPNNIVIVPSDSVLFFWNSGRPGLEQLSRTETSPRQVEYLARASLKPRKSSAMFSSLEKLCRSHWSYEDRIGANPFGRPREPIPGNTMFRILRAALQRDSNEFFTLAAARHEGLLPASFFTQLREWLKIGPGGIDGEFERCRKGISAAVSVYPSFGGQFAAISALDPLQGGESDETDDASGLREWTRRSLRSYVEGMTSKEAGFEDGPAAVDVCLYFDEPISFLVNTVLPVICSFDEAEAFLCGFLDRLLHHRDEGKLAPEPLMRVYHCAAKSLLKKADFAKAYTVETLKKEAQAAKSRLVYVRPKIAKQQVKCMSHSMLVKLYAGMSDSSKPEDDILSPLVAKLIQQAPEFPVPEFRHLWMPFLWALIPVLEERNTPLDSAPVQELYVTIFTEYINRKVGHKPVRGGSLVRPSVACFDYMDCADCATLNHFLVDGSQRVGRFPLNKDRRMHLHQMLDAARIDCSHATERVGRPQTLVVTKTDRYFDEKYWKWETRRFTAAKEISKFNASHLVKLLGPAHSCLQVVRLQPPGDSARQLARTGTKRKQSVTEIDIIDLTRD